MKSSIDEVNEQCANLDLDLIRENTILSGNIWTSCEPDPPNQILEDVFDVGDKLAIIGKSKLMKSFFMLQMAMTIASGTQFLRWPVTKKRRVLYCQFEISTNHMHERYNRMARFLGLMGKTKDVAIFNGRGIHMGQERIEALKKYIKEINPDLVFMDPLYKLVEGVENAAESFRSILSDFDMIVEDGDGRGLIYSHHDTKGDSSDKDIRDRGAGSNILGRDYDAAICLDPAKDGNDGDQSMPMDISVSLILRNYKSQPPFVISWIEEGWKEPDWRYGFEMNFNISANKWKGGKGKRAEEHLSVYAPIAEEYLKDGPKLLNKAREDLKDLMKSSREKMRNFIDWAIDEGIIVMEDVPNQLRRTKQIRLVGQPEQIDMSLGDGKKS